MNKEIVRGRFAPTPSGRMHLGNVLCALLAWLSVRAQQGIMLLRIEDLDPMRCPLSFAEILEEDLLWLGLDWDEGGMNGRDKNNETCIQSLRSDFYEEMLALLSKKAHLYPCFCSRAELHAAQAPHLSDGRVVYAGTCRNLTSEQVSEKYKKRGGAVRIEVPDITVSFTDLIQGGYSEKLTEECGDFILRRSDGVFAYQLAVVADDIKMGVNEIIRGSDLLTSTPRQIWLTETLGGKPASYGHIPLLLAPDGRRLSKRDADLDLTALRKKYTAEDIIGMLAYLCGLIEKNEPCKAQELINEFSWDKLKKSDIRLTEEFYNSCAVKN